MIPSSMFISSQPELVYIYGSTQSGRVRYASFHFYVISFPNLSSTHQHLKMWTFFFLCFPASVWWWCGHMSVQVSPVRIVASRFCASCFYDVFDLINFWIFQSASSFLLVVYFGEHGQKGEWMYTGDVLMYISTGLLKMSPCFVKYLQLSVLKYLYSNNM